MCVSKWRYRQKASQLEKDTLDCFAKTVSIINPADLFINPEKYKHTVAFINF